MNDVFSILDNDDCLKKLVDFKNESIDFVIVDPPYDFYITDFYKQMVDLLYEKTSKNSLIVCFTNNKFLIDCGYYMKQKFDLWFIQHWCFDDGFLLHETQPKDATRSILFFKKGKPQTNIDALRGDIINKEPKNKGNKFRNKTVSSNYIWKPNENGSHPKTYFYHKHTSESHGKKNKPVGVKPFGVCQKILSFSCSQTVVDLFSGNGSFRIEAKKQNKNYHGFEIDKTFFDANNERFNDYFKQTTLSI